MSYIPEQEVNRQKIQADLDKQKTQEERNVMGQFSTPIALAKDILSHAKTIMPEKAKVRFLDPAVGTGSFYSALCQEFDAKKIGYAKGIEIDEHYATPSIELWDKNSLDYQIGDFTKLEAPETEKDKFNLIICNPPYSRHHHLSGQKERLKETTKKVSNMSLSGLSGLYCYFMGLSHPWMKKNGIAGWLIPSEFMDVNYGSGVKDYLLNEVTLLQIHRFDPTNVQFDDALVSSAVVWFKNKKPTRNHTVRFTYGGTIDAPKIEREITADALRAEHKWTRFPEHAERINIENPVISDFFNIKRGIATGDNKFFILSREDIEAKGLPLEQFRPILPSPRYINNNIIESDEDGYPILNPSLFVLDCRLPIEEVEERYPALYDYIQQGIESGVNERYLCSKRKIWYGQENRESSRFYCTYIGRTDDNGRNPFQFILNRSDAIVNNSYLILYPKPTLLADLNEHPDHMQLIIDALGQITGQAMIEEGRVYGGGMHKMEPKELAKVNATEIANLINNAN
ncbi:N-6 DNA methylase [Vibrio vulnificus]|nr:N-6 DNA methylase [Vibrio vulnificus]